MKEKKVEILSITLYLFFVLAVASAKPVSLHGLQFRNVVADSMKSSESSESNESSSENTGLPPQTGGDQPMVAGTEVEIPDTQEVTDPPDTNAVTSETALAVNDTLIASQTAHETDTSLADSLNGTDIEATSQQPVNITATDTPSLSSDVITNLMSMAITALPSVTETTTFQEFHVGTTPPPAPYHKPIMEQSTPQPAYTVQGLTPQQTAPLVTTKGMSVMPGCFTVVYVTSPQAQPVPARGDSI